MTANIIKLNFSLNDLATIKLIEAEFVRLIRRKAKGHPDMMEALFQEACREFAIPANDVRDVMSEIQRHNLWIVSDFADLAKFRFARKDKLLCATDRLEGCETLS